MSGEWTISRKMTKQKEQEDQAEKQVRRSWKGESIGNPEIPDRGEASDIPTRESQKRQGTVTRCNICAFNHYSSFSSCRNVGAQPTNISHPTQITQFVRQIQYLFTSSYMQAITTCKHLLLLLSTLLQAYKITAHTSCCCCPHYYKPTKSMSNNPYVALLALLLSVNMLVPKIPEMGSHL